MQYWRVMLKCGKDNKPQTAECVSAGFVGVDTLIEEDIGDYLSGDKSEFDRRFLPVYMKNRPDRTRIGAGLVLGSLWKVAKVMVPGDIVLSPDGDKFYVGEISGNYYYAEGKEFLHRRSVKWLDKQIPRADMPGTLRKGAGRGTVVNVSHYGEDIKQLLGDAGKPMIMSEASADNISGESAATFALEKHLEDFLVQNWESISLGRDYDIYRDENGEIAQQFPTDTGFIDILAISKDRKTLLVVELKKGNASDRTVGQTMRYIGYIKNEIAEKGQQVRGAIIAASDDRRNNLRIQRALEAVDNVDFYRYKVAFEIEPD